MRLFSIITGLVVGVSTNCMVYGQVTSTFNSGIEGWTAPNSVGSLVTHNLSGGNPGGFVRATPDFFPGGIAAPFPIFFYFIAPATFNGNKSSYYNGSITFDLQQATLTGGGVVKPEVVITDGTSTIYYFPSIPFNPAQSPAWTTYTVSLSTSGGMWKTTNSSTGPAATQLQIQTILANVTSLGISGRFNSILSPGATGIDNVLLYPPITITTQPVSQSFLCNGDIITLMTTATGNPSLTYKWQVFNEGTGGYDDLTDTGGYSGSSTTALSVNTTGGFGIGNYRCKISGIYATDIYSSLVYVGKSGPGAIDKTFVPVANSPSNFSEIEDMIIQPDGKILLNFFETGGTQYNMCRLLSNGTLDPGFTQWPFTLFSGRGDRIALQTDGKVILVGRFTNIGGTNYGRIIRFNSNGTIDNTFNTSQSGFNNSVKAIAIQSDGKVLLGGSFTSYNGTTLNRIVRLNSNGSIDGGFSVGTGFNNVVNSIQIQPDGQILVGGIFNSYNGSSVQAIVRLSPNGNIDPGFTAPTASSVSVIALQSDGKILHELSATGLRRLNTNGTLDNTFNSGSGADGTIYKIVVNPSGKILIGGWFQTFNGTPRIGIARLLPDGSVDGFFNPGTSANSLISTISLTAGNKILVAGYFDYWNNLLQNGIALLDNSCAPIPVAIDNSTCENTITISACGGTNGQYQWYTVASGGTPIAGETNSSIAISNFTSTTTYYVTLKDLICESPRIPVVASKLPSGITAPTATSVSGCGSGALTLTASGTTNGNYRWYTGPVGGVAIPGQTNDTYTTPVLSSTTTFYVSISNGTCESSRTAVTATINSVPTSPTTTSAAACGSSALTLNAAGGIAGQYRWFTVASGGTAIAGQSNSAYTTPILSSTTTYYVSINNGTCESNRTSATATINSIPAAPSTIGATSCVAAAVTLSAAGAINGQYVWYDLPTGGTALAGQVNSTFTTPTLTSSATYYVAINDGVCESTRIAATATIGGATCSNSAPNILSSSTSTTIAGIASIDLNTLITDVDNNLDPASIKITKPPSSGAKAIITNGVLSINYSGLSFAGTDKITIEACDIFSICTQQEFTILVEGDVIVFNGISPNADSFNEKWIIQNIETLPDANENKVTIYNRWGDLIFEVENYDNDIRAFKGINKNGDAVTSGVYFYKIDFKGGRKAMTGYLTVKK